jgi:hypothetical protein
MIQAPASVLLHLRKPGIWLCCVWLPVMLYLGTVACLGILQIDGLLGPGLLASDSDNATGEPTNVGWSAGAHPTFSGNGVQASASPTHTVFLPAMFRDYWEKPESLLGLQIYTSHNAEVANRAYQAGAQWARVPLVWSQAEPENSTPEHYQWPETLDEWLTQLSAREIRVILTLTGNPTWAAEYPGGPLRDGVQISERVEFMEAAVARYSVPPYNIKHWEFYNEPDNGDELYAERGWGYWGNQAADYAAMLEAVYQPMKAIDPEAQIVLGGLAYDWFTTSGGPFVREFLDGVLENNGGAFFDVMNFHYFPSFHANWDPYGVDIIGKANYLRDKLSFYDLEKPFICTETGTWSDAAHNSSDERQSRYVPQVFVRSMAAHLEFTVWFKLIDDDTLGAPKWGLLTAELNPKPSYQAYLTLARQLFPAEYARTLPAAETGTEHIEAYEFLPSDGLGWLGASGPSRIIVAWTDDELDHTMTLQTGQLIMADKYGAETLIRDGDDGRVDGLVQVHIGPSPVYLHSAPSSASTLGDTLESFGSNVSTRRDPRTNY